MPKLWGHLGPTIEDSKETELPALPVVNRLRRTHPKNPHMVPEAQKVRIREKRLRLKGVSRRKTCEDGRRNRSRGRKHSSNMR